jgi:hypothetical protein
LRAHLNKKSKFVFWIVYGIIDGHSVSSDRLKALGENEKVHLNSSKIIVTSFNIILVSAFNMQYGRNGIQFNFQNFLRICMRNAKLGIQGSVVLERQEK